MISSTTHEVTVKVETSFQQVQPHGLRNEYIHAYRITIENNSDHTLKLLRRHWYIVDGLSEVREVEGDGVVGQQPIIEPGDFHQYISGCNMTSDLGKMYGTYTMERLIDGKLFTVEIPDFELIAPFRNN